MGTLILIVLAMVSMAALVDTTTVVQVPEPERFIAIPWGAILQEVI